MMATLHIAPDHPACAGHFPGNPIVPGAWMLAEVAREIAAASGQETAAVTVKSAKFLHPVRPGDSVEIEYTISARHEIRFQCAVAGVKVMTVVMAGALNAATGA
jgi:3-hydroxymyristoyl/3-hydroxydecanoyl-(acyl carrier protein) dehydratase